MALPPGFFLEDTPSSGINLPPGFRLEQPPAPAKPEPTESGGFFGSLGTALKERFATALPAAQLYVGLGDQAAATQELLRAKEESDEAYKQTEFSDIGDAFKKGNYGEALGKTVDKFKEVAGSSVGSMAPAMAASVLGAGAVSTGIIAAPFALPAAAVGTAAFGLTALGSYLADNIGRQKQEQKKKGREAEDIDRLSATAAAAGQAALDVFGFKFFKPLGALIGMEGKATAEKAAMELVQAATQPKAYARAVATGAAKGVAFEVPQEVTQQVLERWQAGLPIDPFTDPEAAKEYLEAAGGALLLGGPMGAYSRVSEVRTARKSPEGQAILRGTKEGTVFSDLAKEEEDVGEVVGKRGREGAGVPPPPDSGVPPAGAPGPIKPGVDTTGQLFEEAAVGEGAKPPALKPTIGPTDFADFKEQYQNIHYDLTRLFALPEVNEDQANTIKQLVSTLGQLVDVNANMLKSPDLARKLKNPEFNGVPELDKLAERRGEPRAMPGEQADLFAEPDEEKRITDIAKMLEQKRQEREQQKAAVPPTAMGDALKAAMEKAKVTPEEITTPAVETTTETVEKAPPVKAPDVSTEHVAQTDEGRVLKGFFDAIAPAAESAQEQEKHQNAKNTAAETLLGYDIVKPGETTSPGIRAALNYIARRVGGTENFQNLLERIQNADPETQATALKNAGLPDLTSRRGMEEFSKQTQEYFKQYGAPAEGGVKVPTKNIPSPVTKAVVPHTEEITYDMPVTRTFGPMPEGKPRRPTTENAEQRRVITDSKLRSAVRLIKQTLDARSKLSSAMLAAKTYLDNKYRTSFGDAFRDAAYDVANYEIDPRNHGANSAFFGEGGHHALKFQEWVNTHLDPETATTFREMVEDFKKNAQEQSKFEEAVSSYQTQLKQYNAERIKKTEAASGVKIPKVKKPVSERISETEVGEQEAIPEVGALKKNLPRVQMLGEVHPLITNMLKRGQTNEALNAIAESKGYYSELAKRLLAANITAKTRLINATELESLSGKPILKDALDTRLSGLVEAVRMLAPAQDQPAYFAALRSENLQDLTRVLSELGNVFTEKESPAQYELLRSTINLFNKEFAWNGKYDPNTDEIVLRQGVGRLTNHLFLHESLHAATLNAIDNPDLLTGVRRQGYDELVKLYNHAKGMLSQQGMSDDHIYGLTDLHEFVSEAMTNPVFQEMLRGISYESKMASLWNSFTQAIAKMFGMKPGRESNVMVEAMRATDAMMAGPVALEGIKGESTAPKAMAAKAAKLLPSGMPNQPSNIRRLMTARNWSEVRQELPRFLSNASSEVRPTLLGALTLRQIADLVATRIPQINNFIKVTEDFLARKNNILRESGEISRRWERLQARDPEMSRNIGKVMHVATITEVDPDKATLLQRQSNPDLMTDWRALSPEAKQIYRDVRDFYERRYSEYKRLMNKRIIYMRQLGVSEQTILEIRNEFEKNKRKGPYFPLMRHGRFWYQIGKGSTREYYMFESQGQKEAHLDDRLARDPQLESTLKEGTQYAQQMDLHARESNFLKAAFDAIDTTSMQGLSPAEADARKQELKDSIYQTFLSNQPERSFRNQFMHRNNVAGYSEDALRNFASSSFHMAYQLARFEHAPDMFSQLDAARIQLKNRFDAAKGYNVALSRENSLLSDYVAEVDRRKQLMLNPTDVGIIPSTLSNVGFIWYLTAPASAIVNVLGGAIIGVPTLVGQYVRANPNASYTKATLEALKQVRTVAGQIISTGFSLERGERLRDNRVIFPSLNRLSTLTGVDRAAYNRFVADGLIDITATYDQSGLAAAPTETYGGVRHRVMEALTALFHNTERFNREVMAMSAFRTAMEKRANYSDKQKAFAESVAEAKDVTNRAMFDYSSTNKPRFFQHPVARIVLQFKQFPQQMTFFLAHNFVNMIRGQSPEVRREATARFVGTMGMAAAFSGATGLWGFSTLAAIVNAVMNGLDDRDEPFDFELEFVNWAVSTFGQNMGTLLTRGIGNAAGVDLASRVKLDSMWFRDSRNNQDEVAALQSFLIEQLGPSVGLVVNVAEAAKLWNSGHADRAIEMISPAFVKNPLVAYRYEKEGVNTLKGDPIMEEVGPFHLLMQSLGIRSAELAERQLYNIKVKGEEQDILTERNNLLNLYGIAFIANDGNAAERAFDKIMRFNNQHPSVAIPADAITNSIVNRLKKSAMTDHGLYIDKRLIGVLKNRGYLE